MREAQAFGKQGSARPAVTLLIVAETRNAECEMRRVGLRKRKTEAFQEPALSEAGGTRRPTGWLLPAWLLRGAPCLSPCLSPRPWQRAGAVCSRLAGEA